MPEEVKYVMSLNDLVTPALDKAENKANQFESSLNKIGGTATKIGIAIAGAFAIGGITTFVNGVVEAGSKVENARTGLTTLLKNQAEASEVIKNTMIDAQKTPFAFEGLLMANKALISAGENSVTARENILNLSNAIAATGGTDVELERMVINLQQIKNTGQATAIDIKQFAIAGINIYKVLANEIYHTTNASEKQVKSIKGMQISYEMLTKALATAHSQTGVYANGLENMAKNTSVQISNVGDALFQFKVKIFDDFKPTIDAVIGNTLGLIQKMSDLYDMAKDKLPEAIRIASSVLKELVFDLKAVAIGVAAMALAYAVAYPQTLLYVGAQIANGVATGALTIATYAMTAAQWALNVALDANPIGLIVIAIGALVTGVILAYKHSATFRAVIAGITQIAKDMVPIFKGLGTIIAGVFTFDPGQIARGFSEVTSAVKNFSMSKSFNKGAAESWAESQADALKEKQQSTIKAAQAKGFTPGKPTAGIGGKTTQASKVTGTKQVNIHITIGSLIKEFKLTAANLKEGSTKVQEAVTQVLLSAVNDSQIIAGA